MYKKGTIYLYVEYDVRINCEEERIVFTFSYRSKKQRRFESLFPNDCTIANLLLLWKVRLRENVRRIM
jgi:hypothetical protein